MNASNVTLNGVTYGYDNDDNVTSKVVTAAGIPAAGSNTYDEFSYAGGEMDAVMTATAGGAQKSVYGRSPAGMLLSGGIIRGAKAIHPTASDKSSSPAVA